jgi:hypothetical protein
MIRTSLQLKALVRNLSKGDSAKALIIIRNYVMERFLERLSVSPYRDNLILKGGTLVAAMVGLDNRSTLDVDATIKNLPLTEESARKIVEDIVGVGIDDGMAFEIRSIAPIMNEAEYSGIRGSSAVIADMGLILDEIENSPDMIALWANYQRKFDYASDIGWASVMQAVRKLCGDIK